MVARVSDSPARPEPSRAFPVKGKPSTTQDAFHRVVKSLRAFAPVSIQPSRLVFEGFSATACAPIRL
jgi:hypothetical protein